MLFDNKNTLNIKQLIALTFVCIKALKDQDRNLSIIGFYAEYITALKSIEDN